MKKLILPILIAIISVYGTTGTIADKIIEYGMSRLGKKVDRGECWDLANAALNESGADWTSPYEFGAKVDINKTQRADILQFSNIKMKLVNGSMSFPKHTAIVYKSNKKQITLIHQNFNNKRYVDTLTINLDDIVKGKVEAFRPKANGS